MGTEAIERMLAHGHYGNCNCWDCEQVRRELAEIATLTQRLATAEANAQCHPASCRDEMLWRAALQAAVVEMRERAEKAMDKEVETGDQYGSLRVPCPYRNEHKRIIRSLPCPTNALDLRVARERLAQHKQTLNALGQNWHAYVLGCVCVSCGIQADLARIISEAEAR